MTAVLEESEARRKGLLESALDCIIWTDSQGLILDFNRAAERTFRMSATKVLGKDLITTIFPASLRERHRRDLFSAAAPSTGVEVMANRLETRGLRSDGSEFPAEITVTGIDIRRKTSFIVYVRDIAARKKAEEALEWLASIVESSQDAIIGKDLEGRVTSWNKGAELMFGYTAKEILGKSTSFLIPGDRSDEMPNMLRAFARGVRTKNFETVGITKNGKLVNVLLTLSPVVDSTGNMIGAAAIAHDISARKATDEALRKATQTSVYASPIPIVGADLDGRITLWNPAAERVFGWTEDEVMGQLNPIIPEQEVLFATELHKRLLAGETLTGIEVRRQRRDGSIVSISLSATCLLNEDRQIRGIIGFLTDITAHKQAEEALRRAEEKYRSIYENATEGIYQRTPDGRYISANPALARMFGFDSADELIAARQDIAGQEYVVPDRCVEFNTLMQQQGVVTNFEYQAYRKDGKITWVSANAHAVYDQDGEVLYFEGSVEDITQHRELEQQIRQMQKIEAIGRLAGGVAHDFNNILMATTSYAELLYRKIPEGDSTRWYVDEIIKAANRGASLTQGLLTFSRKQVLSPKILDLNALITQQIEMLRRLINENIDLKFLPAAKLGSVKADPTQVEQVVMNLVINARDAMPGGGELVIRTQNERLPPSHEFASIGPNCVVLTVSDKGCGMDAETLSHIFEPFFTTKERGKGTGLGLSTVFGIVKQNSGQISVHSEVGQGTAFTIYLPRAASQTQAEAEVVEGGSVFGTETILVVEDEEAVRESTVEYLVENGYTVLKASRGAEGLEVARGYEGTIHLLLTDVIMPQMSGRELSEKIGSIHPETKILFMSGYSNNLLSNKELLDSKYVLLQKPFLLTTLGRCVRSILDNRKGDAASA